MLTKSLKNYLLFITLIICSMNIESFKELQAAQRQLFDGSSSSEESETDSDTGKKTTTQAQAKRPWYLKSESENDEESNSDDSDSGYETCASQDDTEPRKFDNHVFIFVAPSSSGKTTLVKAIHKKMRSSHICFSHIVTLDDIPTKRLGAYMRKRTKLAIQSAPDAPIRKISGENFALVQKILTNCKSYIKPRVILGDTCLNKDENPELIKELLKSYGINNVYIIFVYCPLKENFERLHRRNRKSSPQEQRSPDQISNFVGTYLRGVSPDQNSPVENANGSFTVPYPSPEALGIRRRPAPAPLQCLDITSPEKVKSTLEEHGDWDSRGGIDRETSRVLGDLFRTEGTSPTNDETQFILAPRFNYDHIVNVTEENYFQMVMRFILSHLR